MIGAILELRKLLRYQHLPPSDLKVVQENKLRTVIRHAYENVPYYRSLFHSAGISPEDIRTTEDLGYLPITTKDDLRAAGLEQVVSKRIDSSSCNTSSSSGTTGKPFEVYFSPQEVRTRRLIGFRELLSIGYRPKDRLCVLRGGYDSSHSTRFHHRLGLYRTEYIPIFLPMEEQIRRLKEMQPTVLRVGPNHLRALLHHVDDRLSAIVQPRVLINSGQSLARELRKRIRADRDIEICDFYVATEFGEIAGECSAHEGLHVNADQLLLECLQGEKPSQPGEPGVVVITSLYGFSMPFIRYRLGDICTLVKEPCSCGSSFPLISPPFGRDDDVIRLPSGKILSAIGLFLPVNEVGGIDQYRFIQENPQHFVLQLVLWGNPGEEALSEMRAELLEYLGEPVRLDIQIVDHIPEDTRMRKFISRLSQSG